MNFIWDAVLQAESAGLRKADLFFKQADIYSPYYELAFPIINQATVDHPLIEINALYRFSHLVQEMLHPDVLHGLRYGDITGFIDYLFDALLHYVSEIDLRHGLNRREFYVRKLRQELLNGDFGPVAAAGMASMKRALQIQMAHEVLISMETGSSLYSFRRALRTVFPSCLLYQSNYDSACLLFYLDQMENVESTQQLRFLVEGFLPLDFHLRPFWHYHFGILGVDATMKADSIALF